MESGFGEWEVHLDCCFVTHQWVSEICKTTGVYCLMWLKTIGCIQRKTFKMKLTSTNLMETRASRIQKDRLLIPKKIRNENRTLLTQIVLYMHFLI